MRPIFVGSRAFLPLDSLGSTLPSLCRIKRWLRGLRWDVNNQIDTSNILKNRIEKKKRITTITEAAFLMDQLS